MRTHGLLLFCSAVIRRFIDDRQAWNRLGATESWPIATDQKKINESKTKKPTDEGWLFAWALLPDVFTAQSIYCPNNKTDIAELLLHCCLRTGLCLLGLFKGCEA
ncbi:hypothetical protein [Achromobacter sp. UBA2119]|uniref:hypothetical protein n=1 Tax=Achromobacter sp. UBA2119 TaxID=1945911 RepID=UPI00257DC034|nr:hypothetical protein [Achromobacter sp. UBA2119]